MESLDRSPSRYSISNSEEALNFLFIFHLNDGANSSFQETGVMIHSSPIVSF